MRLRGIQLLASASLLALLVPAAAWANVATINPGDTISVTATLTTTDPNENGEGEPLVITADGANINVIFNYGIPSTTTYTAPPVLTAPGAPIPTTSIGYYIQGADGDESASFSTAVNAPPSAKTQQQIDQWNKDAAILGIAGGVIGAISAPITLVPGWGTIAGITGGALAGLTSAVAGYFALLAADPVDPNYKVVATPGSITLPASLSSSGLAADEAKAIEVAAALITSLNRYQGAEVAGDSYWKAQQLAAVDQYTAELNSLTGSISSDLRTLAANLTAVRGGSVTITPQQVLQIEQYFANYGLSSETIALLQQLGLTPAQIQLATQNIYVQNINSVAGVYPDVLVALANDLSPIPEPATWAVFLLPLALLPLLRRASPPARLV